MLPGAIALLALAAYVAGFTAVLIYAADHSDNRKDGGKP